MRVRHPVTRRRVGVLFGAGVMIMEGWREGESEAKREAEVFEEVEASSEQHWERRH